MTDTDPTSVPAGVPGPDSIATPKAGSTPAGSAGAGRRTRPAAGGDGLDAVSYTDAVAELERILAELERDNVDVDHLATRVERAAALIAHCRGRISAAQLQIERVVSELDS